MPSHETPRSLENDGHGTVLRRTDETVVLYARSGRVVTQHWMDLAVAGMELRPGTVLDGEAVIWRNGRLDFAAAQSRAASSVTRARALAAQYPASYVCWDVLQHPDPAIGDCRRLPYTERSGFLPELLTDVGPPIQVVPATDDRDVDVLWYDALCEQGIAGDRLRTRWGGLSAVRTAPVVESPARGHGRRPGAGVHRPRLRPHHLVLAVGDEGGPARVSARLEPVLAARVGEALSGAAVVGERRAEGEPYTRVETDLVVEVLAGSGRHGNGVVADDRRALARRAQEDVEDTARGLAPAFWGYLAEERAVQRVGVEHDVGHGRAVCAGRPVRDGPLRSRGTFWNRPVGRS
ncbi:hypothetical protein ACFC5Z_14855 [Streptomyces sp. NPDC056004]|uniref:ATP-dependent DNA ligase n=1 Tax=unclassified Streptomyces TaxID=2593676 RepID=UPI0035E0837C